MRCFQRAARVTPFQRLKSAVWWSMRLFWLRYRHRDGRFAGVVVLDSSLSIFARIKAAWSGAVQGLDFIGAHQISEATARQISADIIGRLVCGDDLRNLREAIKPRKTTSHRNFFEPNEADQKETL